jgi:hypothetical protein
MFFGLIGILLVLAFAVCRHAQSRYAQVLGAAGGGRAPTAPTRAKTVHLFFS